MAMNFTYETRKKLRLKGFDYGSKGYYFITICTKGRIHYFGDVVEGNVILNDYGEAAEECWGNIVEHYEGIELDEFIIMPNHIHGIIIVGNEYFRSDISNVIKGFKIGVTKEIRQNHKDYEFAWQKSFHDVIIRNQDQLDKSREYIRMNPMKWEEDENNIC
ncbi:transposase [Candidatus Gracilibacteria bacterium]|nr:transposase [Candidatus Gracilibacteria bacterium]